MKYLSLLLLLSCGQVVAQKKDTVPYIRLLGSGVTFTGYMEGKTEVGHDAKGNLVVKGDSAAAIKLLFKMIDAGAKREEDHWRIIAQYEERLATIRRMLDKLVKANTVKH